MAQAQTNLAFKQMNVDNEMNLCSQTWNPEPTLKPTTAPLNKYVLKTTIGINRQLGNSSCHCVHKSWVRKGAEFNILYNPESKLISAYVT